MFNLLRYYSISSALVILVLGLALVRIVTWYEASRLIADTERHHAAVAEKIAAVAWEPRAAALAATSRRLPRRSKASAHEHERKPEPLRLGADRRCVRRALRGFG